MFERFSSHSLASASPPQGPRSFSPAPRKPNNLTPSSLARPPFNARSSSLSLKSRQNSSTTSLLGAARNTNGSALKQELGASVEDPLDVLEQIVGLPRPLDEDNGPEETALERPAELVTNVPFGNLSLTDFVREKAPPNGQQRAETEHLSTQSAGEYEKEREKFEDLHRSIRACDNVLQSVESSLAGFQRDLGAVSTEIETLQNRSTALNNRLENRRKVEKLLGPAVENVSIPPHIVAAISEGPVDEAFIKALAELQKKLSAVEKNTETSGNIRALADVRPLLENLKHKALERARDYIVTQIKAVRSPNMNAQIIQQQKLVKFKELYTFLARHHEQLAKEIGQAYVNTMRWYYLNHFTRYKDALEKLAIIRFEKADLMGNEPSAQRSKAVGAPPGHDAYTLGRRGDILKPSNHAALPSYVAEDNKSAHFIEAPFRSLTLALIDNVSAEYAFQAEFFAHPPTSTHSAAARRCAAVFEPTYALARAFVADLAAAGPDCLGLLLCVRLSQRAAFVLQRRRCPAADAYVNGAALLLWPRFQQAMDAHAESVRAAAAGASARGAASRLAVATGAGADAARQSAAPHPLTQRFSQFLRGIVEISREAGDDEPVASSLGRLRAEYEGFLQKASKGAGADQRKRDRFLANNYSLVLTIVGDAEGKLATEQKTAVEQLSQAVADRDGPQ